MSIGIQLVIPKALRSGERTPRLLNALRAASPTIAATIAVRIRERTPRLMGALREAETGKPYPSPVSGTTAKLADFYAEEGPQLDTWGRVYVAYQEGDIPTYTNAPHHMFGRVETEDLSLIEAWATTVVEQATDGLDGSMETLSYGDAG